MTLKRILQKIELLNKLQPLCLLFLRLVLAYGFFETGKMKWENINSVAEWFESIGIIAPKLSAYSASSVELLGVLLLLIGFGVRIISIPLLIIMIVAIKTVHLQNGFSSAENGFEIPLYYLLMLFVLVTQGAGKFSLDFFIKQKLNTK
ncbi:MAG: DoxX family protein [Bacteroidetes bacterium]|nr:DoxX family protein [Bacteroidota bacterium]